VGLPMPTAVVNSGGGLHVYWISNIPLSPDEWRPYAEGLKQLLIAEDIKCDYGLTTDDVRILRVPGTLNHKYNPPRPVQLLHLGADYNFVTDLAFLKQVAPAASDPAQAREAAIEPGFAAAPDPTFASLNPAANDVSAGIEPGKSNTLLDPRPIFEQCGFMRHAFATGGKDYDNPLWNLSVLATTFMENGNVIAHEISKGHATYTPADTQALYDRKVVDRHDRGVGYPSCAAIAGAGCTACKTCPHFTKGKSPLNIRPVVTDTSSPSSSSGQRPSSTTETTVNYVPGNEFACRAALDNVVAADLSTFTSGDILIILRVPDRQEPAFERWDGDLPGTTPALPADIIERAERLSWMAPTGGKGEQRWQRRKPPRDFSTDYITQRRGRYAARLLVGIAGFRSFGMMALSGPSRDTTRRRASSLIVRQSWSFQISQRLTTQKPLSSG
jgi:hypothetical protein